MTDRCGTAQGRVAGPGRDLRQRADRVRPCGQSAVEDNWVAVLVAILALVGLLASLAAFVLAVAAKQA